MHKLIDEFRPDVIVVDPITNLVNVGTQLETHSMLTRLIDYLKTKGITSLLTSLTTGGDAVEESEVGISSLIDTWLLLAIVRSGGERNRTVAIIKSRGMPHSNQASEFRLSERGFELLDAYLGASGVLTGSARIAKEAEDKAAAVAHARQIERLQQQRESRRRLVEAKIAELRHELEVEEADLDRAIHAETRRQEQITVDRNVMARSRLAFGSANGKRNVRSR